MESRIINSLETYIGECSYIIYKAIEIYGLYYKKPIFDFKVRDDLEKAYRHYALEGDEIKAYECLNRVANKLNAYVQENMVPKDDDFLIMPNFHAYKCDFIQSLSKEKEKIGNLRKS